MAPPPTVNIKIHVSARDRLRRLGLTLSAAVGRQLSLSEVIDAACQIADRHADELLDLLNAESPSS